MVDRLEQEERYSRDLNIVKRARFNQTIEPNQTKEVPAKPGVKPHSRVKELPALPVREPQQDNMLQQHQDNMLEDGEVVSFGQRAQQQDQQQLQLRQHNIPHNPVYRKTGYEPKSTQCGSTGNGWSTWSECIISAEQFDTTDCSAGMGQELREIVQGNNASIEQITADVQRIKQAMRQIVNGLNDKFGQVRTDAQNQQQGIVTIYQQLGDAQRRIGLLETEANRLQTAEIGALKERCKKIEHEQLKSDRKWPQFNEQLDRIQKLERELRSSNERIELLERKLLERDHSPRNASQPLMEKVALMEKRLREAGLATEQSGQHELIRLKYSTGYLDKSDS